MSNPVLSAIADRRSIRGYEPQQISKEQLDALLLAAVQSPSAHNEQPWHFSVVQNAELLNKISDEAVKVFNREGSIFYGAPTAIFISCKMEERWPPVDCGIAVQTIAIAAQALGLGSVILGLPDPAFNGPHGDEFKKACKFPEGYNFAVAIAVGIPTGTKEAHPVAPNRIDIIA